MVRRCACAAGPGRKCAFGGPVRDAWRERQSSSSRKCRRYSPRWMDWPAIVWSSRRKRWRCCSSESFLLPAPWTEPAPGESNEATPIVLGAFSLLFGLAAYWNTTNVAANSLRELNYFRHELATIDPSTTRNLRVICPAKVSVFVDRPLKMDFRYAGTNHDLGVPGIVEAVLAEEGRNRGDLVVSVVHAGDPAVRLALPDKTRTIDVTRLLPRR